MEYKELQNLIKLIDSSNLAELKMKDGEFELQIRTKEYYKQSKKMSQTVQTPVVQSAPVAPAPPSESNAEATIAAAPVKTDATESPAPEAESNLLDIKSPIVGTFYRSPSPDKDVYVKIGDQIDVGGVVCIVEAMKLFNEIESEVKGKIVEILVEDSTPVEYDQVLFRVDPS